MSATQERLTVTQAEAARMIGVSDRTIRQWERLGIIKGRQVRPGGAKFYELAAVKKLVIG